MVRGEAKEMYDDYGSLRYSWEFYLLFIVVFIALISCCALFRIQRNSGGKKEHQEKKDALNGRSIDDLSRLMVLKQAFIHPIKLQEDVFRDDPFRENYKFLSKVIPLVFSGILVILYFLQALPILSKVEYYASYWLPKIHDAFPWIMTLVLVIGALLIFITCEVLTWSFAALNRFFIHRRLENKSHCLSRREINGISVMSLPWQGLFLILAGLLLSQTISPLLTSEITRIFTETTVIEVYEDTWIILRHIIRMLPWIVLLELPFAWISVRIFSQGIEKHSVGKATRRNARNAWLGSFLIVLVVLILLFMGSVLSIDALFSLISVESLN